MSRYRPPPPPKSPYITPAGAKRMREEIKYLWEEERPIITNTVHEAAKNGDRSENGDYIYGKQRLRKIDSRVRYLTKRLEKVVVVDTLPADTSKAFFSAFVELEDEHGDTLNVRIVGCDEIDPKQNFISFDSPMAKALIGKKVDEDIFVRTPNGIKEYVVVSIRYENS